MSLEIRPIRDDEVEQAEAIVTYSFNAPDRHNVAAAAERARKFYSVDWSLASFEDGEMTAFVRTLPFVMRINGRGLPLGAVGPVVAAPGHRRRGHVGALLNRAHEVMRERGQVWAALHTPHPTLYRRYGYEIASVRRRYAFPPKDTELLARPSERGRFRLVERDDWPLLDRLYRRHNEARNCPIHRFEVWWREAILGPPPGDPLPTADVALWEDGSGEPQGYVVYQQAQGHQPETHDTPRFLVRELVALTPDAYLNLLGYILRHDLPREIVMLAPPDDPFPSLVADLAKVHVEEEYDLLIRIVDVEAALRQRPLAYGGHDCALTIEVADATAPWNDSRWRIEVTNGETNVERTPAEPDVSLDVTTLAPVFNGFLPPRAAAQAGLLHVHTGDALQAAETFFAVRYPPYCADGF